MTKTTIKATILLTINLLLFTSCVDNGSKSNNNPIDFEKKANELLSSMTLEEKVSQMSYESPAIERLGIPEYNWWNECLHGVARAGYATVFPQSG